MATPPLCLDTPYTSPEGDINDDMAVDSLDVQLAINVFLGSNVDQATVDRADDRVCATGYITPQTHATVVDIFLVGYS